MQNSITKIERVWDDDAVMPITLAEAKKQCLVDHSVDDTLITDLIAQTISEVEDYCSISIIPQEITFFGSLYNAVTLPYPPVIELTGVQTRDANSDPGVPEYLDVDDDWMIIGDQFTRTWWNSSSVSLNGWNYDHKLVYSAGMTTITPNLKRTILNLIAFRYQNKGDHAIDLSEDLKNQLNKFKDCSW